MIDPILLVTVETRLMQVKTVAGFMCGFSVGGKLIESS